MDSATNRGEKTGHLFKRNPHRPLERRNTAHKQIVTEREAMKEHAPHIYKKKRPTFGVPLPRTSKGVEAPDFNKIQEEKRMDAVGLMLKETLSFQEEEYQRYMDNLRQQRTERQATHTKTEASRSTPPPPIGENVLEARNPLWALDRQADRQREESSYKAMLKSVLGGSAMRRHFTQVIHEAKASSPGTVSACESQRSISSASGTSSDNAMKAGESLGTVDPARCSKTPTHSADDIDPPVSPPHAVDEIDPPKIPTQSQDDINQPESPTHAVDDIDPPVSSPHSADDIDPPKIPTHSQDDINQPESPTHAADDIDSPESLTHAVDDIDPPRP